MNKDNTSLKLCLETVKKPIENKAGDKIDRPYVNLRSPGERLSCLVDSFQVHVTWIRYTI